jgi:hypothetical protein
MSPTGLGLPECVVMERPVMARKADLGQGYIFKVTGSITPQPQRVFNRRRIQSVVATLQVRRLR